MSDQCIQYNEEMVGAGHPTKPDTLNRLSLVECDTDGKGKYRYLKHQASAPSTAAGEGAIYFKSDGLPYYRKASNGAEVMLGGGNASIQFGRATLNPGGTGWRTVTIAPSPSVIMANTMLVAAHGTSLRCASGRIANSWTEYLSAVNAITIRAYFEANYNFYFSWALNEFAADQAIQRAQSIKFAGGSTGARTDTITLGTPVADYTKTLVHILNFGQYTLGENNPAVGFVDNIEGRMTANDTITLNGEVGATDSTGFTISWEILPRS